MMAGVVIGIDLAFAAPARRLRIVQATAGKDAGVLGAAYIAWQGKTGSGSAIR
jgi:predicted NBD/HSP70 family sugar kinase